MAKILLLIIFLCALVIFSSALEVEFEDESEMRDKRWLDVGAKFAKMVLSKACPWNPPECDNRCPNGGSCGGLFKLICKCN